MSGWWLLLAFAGGYVACWKFSNWIVKKALRQPGVTERALSSMRHDNLRRLRDYVSAELEARRTP